MTHRSPDRPHPPQTLTVQRAIITSSKRRAEKLEKEAIKAKERALDDAKKCVKVSAVSLQPASLAAAC